MIALAQEKHLILAEAMTIWHMPIYEQLGNIIKDGTLGKVLDHNNEFWQFQGI